MSIEQKEKAFVEFHILKMKIKHDIFILKMLAGFLFVVAMTAVAVFFGVRFK